VCLPATALSKGISFEEAKALGHQEFDAWFEQFRPLFEEGRKPSLTALSSIFKESRAELMGGCMKVVVEQLYRRDLGQKQAPCPLCGRMLKCRRMDDKLVSTLNGEFILQRPYFYCTGCGHGFHPLDEFLELARERHQHDVQELAVQAAAEMPFDVSAKLFSKLTGVNVGEHFQHETAHAVGEAANLENVVPDREEIERCIAQVTHPSEELPILVVAADGAHMPTRPKAKRKEKRGAGNYREAKGFRLYLVAGKGKPVQVASWHQIQNAEQFREDLALVASRIPQDKVRVALLADGAEWLWPAMTACFPKGRPILDYYHCAEHVHAVAKIQFGEGEMYTCQWAEGVLSLLYWSGMDEVLEILRGMTPRHEEARESIRKLIGYLEKNQDRIHYEADRDEGFPIGSGGIESAHKFICHTRLKRSGAWWVTEMGNSMLRLRCALVNGTYKKVFEHYRAWSRQTSQVF